MFRMIFTSAGLVASFLLSACSSSTTDMDHSAAAAAGESSRAGASNAGSAGVATSAGGLQAGGSEPVAGAPSAAGAAAGGTAGVGTQIAGAGGSSSAGAGAGGRVGSGGSAGAGSSGSADPGNVGDGDLMVGPTYTPSPDLRLEAGAPAGFSTSFTMTSAMSNIFKGDDFSPAQPFSRSIRVWVPEQYVDGSAAPFMVSSDGFYAGLQTVVQNLADSPTPERRVPPLVIIGVQNGPDVQPKSERSLEYDTVSDRYWQFVTKEVIPAVLANAALKAKFPNFKLTSDPNGRGGYGCSSGGPAVLGLAWFGDFNRVLSFSGSYVALQRTTDHPDGAWEYPKLVTDAPLRPDLRVFLEVGQNDNGSTTADTGKRNWVSANRNLAAALKAKGNHYRFVFAQGAGHCDNNARNQVMPEGLIWLWRGYRPN